jgi:hypothetical protein
MSLQHRNIGGGGDTSISGRDGSILAARPGIGVVRTGNDPREGIRSAGNTHRIPGVPAPIRRGYREGSTARILRVGLRDPASRGQDPGGLTYLLSFGKRTESTAEVYRRKLSQGLYTSIEVTSKVLNPLRPEEGRETAYMRGLLKA